MPARTPCEARPTGFREACKLIRIHRSFVSIRVIRVQNGSRERFSLGRGEGNLAVNRLATFDLQVAPDSPCYARSPFLPCWKLSMWRLLKEFLLFARQEKKWWLVPLIVLLLALGAILVFGSSSGIAWALYPFF